MKEGEIIMKLSKFANVLKNEQSYIIHQTLYNSIMSVDSDEYKKIIDNLLINKTIDDYTDDNEFYKALVDQNILVEEVVDSYCDKLMGIYEAALRNQYFSENQ